MKSKMQGFKDYLIDEWKDGAEDYVGTEFKFSHTVSVKADKKSQVSLRIDSIKVNVKFFNKDMTILLTKSLTFENNELQKAQAKKLVNISPDELNNRFAQAKVDICKTIVDEYKVKYFDLNEKINQLYAYTGRNIDVTPDEFKGESIKVVEPVPEEKAPEKKSKKYDM